MISSFSQEQFQQFYVFSGGGNNRKVPFYFVHFPVTTMPYAKQYRPTQSKALVLLGNSIMKARGQFYLAGSLFYIA